MGIFDRLSRLARSEANHLFDAASDAAQGAFSSGDKARARATSEPSAPADADPWPDEIKEDYAALELPLGADRGAVKVAYRDLLRRYHPDRHAERPDKAELANELTVRIRQSYERLDAFLAAREG